MKKVLFLVLALVLGGLFASSTYDDASAKGRVVVVKKKKKRGVSAEWVRTPAIVRRSWSWGWWTPRRTHYGTPIWTLRRYGHRGVYVRR